MKCFIRFAAFFVLCPAVLSAADFGLRLEQAGEYEAQGTEEGTAVYSASLVPWLSSPLGENGDLYFSAGIKARFDHPGDWTFIPELFRTGLEFRLGPAEIRAGRIHYSDPMGFIAAGLFDGLAFALETGDSILSAGVWYTGFLYKKTASVTMTEEDLAGYYEDFDWGDFTGTYFASRRVLAALGWEHPAIAEIVRLKFALIGQFDLNQRETALHSQYLAAKITVPAGDFVFDAGGAAELVEFDGSYKPAFAGEASIAWMLPTTFQDRLMLKGRYSGGEAGQVTAFVPVTSESQGNVIKARFSGVSLAGLSYTARLHKTFSVTVEDIQFFKSGSGTYRGWPAGDGTILGNEAYARLVWNPLSDLRFELGGGIFLPALGNTAPEEAPRWRAELSAVLALY